MSDFLMLGLSEADMIKKLTLARFTYFSGNRQKTADSLGISVRTVYSRLEEYLPKEEVKEEVLIERMPKAANEAIKRKTEEILASQGVPVQSDAEISTERKMPVPERGQVQEMLRSENAANNSHKRGIRKGAFTAAGDK